MDRLIETLQEIGYRFEEGAPLRTVDHGGKPLVIRQLTAVAPSGQSLLIPCDTSPLLFPGDEDEHAASCAEVYRAYYALDNAALCFLLQGYTLKTQQYLKMEKARIGLIGYKEGLPEGFFARDKYPIPFGIGDVDVGRYADGRYVAQSAQAIYGDTHVLRLHFDHYPTRPDVEDAVIIRKLERDFRMGRHKETFICADCGLEKHWLDIDGPIGRKLRMRLSRRCGCRNGE